jgi:hypothetical protein
MTNEANIDIQVDDNDVSALVSTLASLKEVLESNARAMSRLESNTENLESDLKDVEQAADGARRAVDALGVAAAGAAAAFAVVGAGIEGVKVSIEAFAETNAEAGARMEALSTSAQTLLGNFGRVALGGDNFAQTLEVLTRMFELLNEYVGQNSDALSRMATSVLRVLIQAFFGLIDVGFEVVRFVTRLDLSLLALEAGFLRAKAAVLEFASDALEGIGDFAAGAIESFADFLDSLDDVQTSIIDNPVGRALFGIEEGSITGPVGALAEGMRSVADSIRNSTSDTFADNIERARDRADELNNIIENTPDPTVELQAGMREVRDQTLRWIDDLENVVPREIDVNLNVVGGAGGGGTSPSGREAIDTSLEFLIGGTAAGLKGAEALYTTVITRLLQVSADARRQFKLDQEGDGNIVPVNVLSAAANSELVAEYENMLERRRAALAEYEELEQRLTSSIASSQQQIRENDLLMESSYLYGGAPMFVKERTADIMERYGLSEEQFNAAQDRLFELQSEAARQIEESGKGPFGDAQVREAARDLVQQNINEQNAIIQAALQEEQQMLRLAAEERQDISSASYDRETALLQKFYNQTSQIVIQQTEIRAEMERNARLKTQQMAEQDAADILSIAQGLTSELGRGPFTIDTSVLTTGIGRRADRDRRRRLQEVGATQFSSEAEALKALTSALTDQERAWAAANGGVKAYIDRIAELKEETREAFKADALDAFENTFITLGSTIGTALGGGFDDSITGAERAKAVLFELLGSTLQALGSTAIAQGTIYAFGDPRIGGFANPVGAAGLIAAGTAAIAVGSAFSARAGAIQSGAGAPGVTPATTPGGGGASESTTNVFIENRFGNRFDAREVDRAAAESFAAAASAGQA